MDSRVGLGGRIQVWVSQHAVRNHGDLWVSAFRLRALYASVV